MKYIQKRGEPTRYSRWRLSVGGTAKEDYRELPRPEKQALLSTLVREQGFLCAYTMKGIDEASAHVEHIKPQSQCRQDDPGSDLNYRNMVACFPRDGMKAVYRYGAQQKGSWWDQGGASFISPLHVACEVRFRFDREGRIRAAGGNLAAVTTIGVLALDHGSLTEERKRVIVEFIFGSDRASPLSKKQTQRSITGICDRDGQGQFRVFCVALRHALEDHIGLLRKLTSRKRHRGRRI
jgi:uncharacterized protein (TIGR02646 family)